ncbi:MAG: hypothetical protein GY913_10540 [Proteobacteria bacterium]|nr:hypothetical protein [Pseudomonadota bacterium]MCP4917351.1 hypothetical protein [Pseudomonadota bacterium]
MLLGLLACNGAADLDLDAQDDRCVTVHAGRKALARDGDGYDWGDVGEPFRLQASDLGTYLLYDSNEGYLTGAYERATELESDMTTLEDGLVSPAEWVFADGLVLRNRATDLWLGKNDLVGRDWRAQELTLEDAEGCAEFPELSLDASGEVTQTTWDDGDLYGFTDAHSHLLTNNAFGGYMYHGGAYHRLGVEHALPDCAAAHGEMGRRDFFGYVWDGDGNDTNLMVTLLASLGRGELDVDNHATDGFPTFSDWPNATNRSTHQTQYHRWLERSWMSGLRLVVNHATSNSVICNLMVGEGIAPARYDCDDMTAVDRTIDEAWAMQDWIDAQHGGPGKGWFRIVTTPAEARQVIQDGKLAVVLGIETSDLFRCNLTPREGGPVCDEAYVDEQLDLYWDRGVRAVFPNHKYDNAFTPGDGSNGFLEAGNFFNSGHFTNQTEDCPEGVPTGFDGGGVTLSGLLEPRDEFMSDPPVDMSDFPTSPLDVAIDNAEYLLDGSLDGDYCQNGTLTPVGEALFAGLMQRGMLIELDHLPAHSYARAYELLEANDYPALGTHGRHWDGRLFALDGFSGIGFGQCQDPDDPGSTIRGALSTMELRGEMGSYPSLGFAFDLNGFAGKREGRFVRCEDQTEPIEYPFESYAGDVTFTEPFIGERPVDYNVDGFVHIGMIPELIEDARHDAASDEDLEPLFRSAEAYVRMWEKAEERAGR